MPTGLVGSLTVKDASSNTVGINNHCFWNGTLWGRTVALQGGPSMDKYDVFVYNGGTLNYYATFRGNPQSLGGFSDADSYDFNTPIVFLNQSMQVGQTINSTVNFKLLATDARQFQQQSAQTARVTLNAHYDQYTIPESGAVYNDVVQFTYLSNANDPSTTEVYWLANGYGFIRTQLSGSGNGIGYAGTSSSSFSQVGQKNTNGGNPSPSKVQYPTMPWYDPFQTPYDFGGHLNVAYVPNGFFSTNNGVNHAVVGNATNLAGWN